MSAKLRTFHQANNIVIKTDSRDSLDTFLIVSLAYVACLVHIFACKTRITATLTNEFQSITGEVDVTIFYTLIYRPDSVFYKHETDLTC